MSVSKTAKVTTDYMVTCPKCGKDGKLVVRLRHVVGVTGPSIRVELYIRHGRELHSVSRSEISDQIKQRYGKSIDQVIEEVRTRVEPRLKLELPASVQVAATRLRELEQHLARVERSLSEAVKCISALQEVITQESASFIAERTQVLEQSILKVENLVAQVKSSLAELRQRVQAVQQKSQEGETQKVTE